MSSYLRRRVSCTPAHERPIGPPPPIIRARIFGMDAAGRSMHEERLVQLSVPLPCLLQGYSNSAHAMQAKTVRLLTFPWERSCRRRVSVSFHCATKRYSRCRGGDGAGFSFSIFEGVL